MAPLAIRAILLLTLATEAAASQDSACKADSCEEPLSLLQNDLLKSVHRGQGVSIHQAPHAHTDSIVKAQGKWSDCSCLNWKQTYESGSAICGKANEFYYYTGQHSLTDQVQFDTVYNTPGVDATVGMDECEHFFSLMNNNYCANINVGASQGQWCYVSSACAEGTPVPESNVSWKTCGVGDTQLKDFVPSELATVESTFHVKAGILARMSYPLIENHLWNDVKEYWNCNEDALEASLRQEMHHLKYSGKPYLFNFHADGFSPYAIVWGKKKCYVNPEFTSFVCREQECGDA